MTTLDDLQQRLTTLGKTARRWRRTSTALALCVLSALLIAAVSRATVTDELRVKKLVLVDDQGRTAAEMATDNGKFSGLKFYNPQNSTVVAGMGTNADGTGVLQTRTMLLVDEQGRTVADLLYAKDKASGLRFYNPETKFCVSGFGFGTHGSGVEYLNTKEGKTVVIHTGAVNEKGVPLEDVQKALDQLRRSAIP